MTSEFVELIDEALDAGKRGDRDHMFAIFTQVWMLATKAAAHRSDVLDLVAERLRSKPSVVQHIREESA